MGTVGRLKAKSRGNVGRQRSFAENVSLWREAGRWGREK